MPQLRGNPPPVPRNPPALPKKRVNRINNYIRPANQALRNVAMQGMNPLARNAALQGMNSFVSAAYAQQRRGRAPLVNGTYKKTRIIHSEFLQNISGTSGFSQAVAININPGLSASFPWLATQAAAWEQYRFNKLQYRYVTRSGTNQAGSVLMIPEYDAADSAPANEQIASTYDGVVEDVCWKPEIVMRFDNKKMHPLGPRHFIRTGNLAVNLDIKTYDSGLFFLYTNDGSSSAVGKLWVDYDVELINPQLPNTGDFVPTYQHVQFTSATTANPLGLSGANVSTPGSDSIITVSSGGVITFAQPGSYNILIGSLAGTSNTTPLLTGSATAILNTKGVYADTTTTHAGLYLVSSSPAISIVLTQTVNITAAGGQVTWSNTIVGTCDGDVIVSSIKPTQA